MSSPPIPDAWISVSRAALRHNFAAVRTLVQPSQVIAVVKANAFGHGAVETARVFQEAGADFFAVTTPDEALELRAAGIVGRILVFLPPLPEQVPVLLEADVDVTICDAEGLERLAQAHLPVRVHLKVDTGMGRLGALPPDVPGLAARLMSEPTLNFAGIYTHFARALDKDSGATRRQFEVFQTVLAGLERAGSKPGLRHCANSAALVRFPEMRLDAVRPGTILYGQYPSPAVPKTLDLQETWQMSARVVSVREVPAGTSVGYGGEWTARRPTRLAVLPVGYADGFAVAPLSAHAGWRGLKSLLRPSQIMVGLRGRRAPVVGRVAMQICTVDVTDIPGVSVGDVVSVPARRLTASARLPRVYQERFD